MYGARGHLGIPLLGRESEGERTHILFFLEGCCLLACPTTPARPGRTHLLSESILPIPEQSTPTVLLWAWGPSSTQFCLQILCLALLQVLLLTVLPEVRLNTINDIIVEMKATRVHCPMDIWSNPPRSFFTLSF